MSIGQDRGRSIARATAEARRTGRVITPALTAELDLLVATAYRTTQERVGVESGALKASGRSGSDVRDDHTTYVGFIGYGNGTPPVDYALYHLAVNEPWFEGIPATEAAMEATIDAHLRRHLR